MQSPGAAAGGVGDPHKSSSLGLEAIYDGGNGQISLSTARKLQEQLPPPPAYYEVEAPSFQVEKNPMLDGMKKGAIASVIRVGREAARLAMKAKSARRNPEVITSYSSSCECLLNSSSSGSSDDSQPPEHWEDRDFRPARSSTPDSLLASRAVLTIETVRALVQLGLGSNCKGFKRFVYFFLYIEFSFFLLRA